MRIILTENDIKKALIAYTSTLGLDLSNHHVAIELTAGRGANGHSATVIIDEAEDIKELTGTAAVPVTANEVVREVKVHKPKEEVVEEVNEATPLAEDLAVPAAPSKSLFG
jgi:hypothetical protein